MHLLEDHKILSSHQQPSEALLLAQGKEEDTRTICVRASTFFIPIARPNVCLQWAQVEEAGILVSVFLVSFAFALDKAIRVPSIVPLATSPFNYHYQLATTNTLAAIALKR
ncbi:hypothetical protein BCR34DRAFT_597135 [Clohesyomyces aquaticus]|uniref:Uncharacterized protein n=1 Tax=Clohesyomyces aquaticus TaxID=1231657 RepID=A0A1Y2A4C7_9PLEO|nr:hypothetical protein BCR34DRAFT_597135 [Clohesyomyces aquaticus]